MNNVYLSKNIKTILNKIDYSHLGQKVAIKLHFGEKGCDTYLDPKIAKAVYKKIESLGKKPTLVECNVLYKGSRTNSTDHLKTAKEHGFADMDIDILDGEKGEKFIEINGCKLGAGIKKYDSLIVLSHFKGHPSAGFGAAIKNIGMGFGSRAGKLHMHSQVSPVIDPEQCLGCGLCIKGCDFNAISIVNNKAQIDPNKCKGCAMCISVCLHHAANPPWGSATNDYLQEMIAKYAASVLSLFPNTIFINVLKNITPLCDCFGQKQKPIMDDIGIVYSTNISAIDQASLDLANKHSKNKFDKINKVNKNNQIKFTQKLNLGKSDYKLINL
jgi:hypothetical protein